MLSPTVAGTVLISVNLEDRLGDVGTDYRDYLRGQLTNRGSLNSAHIRGTLGPVEEPSTASYPDTFTAAFWPSIKPTCLRPWRTAETNDAKEAGKAVLRKPTTGPVALSVSCKRQRDRPAENNDGGTSPHILAPHVTNIPFVIDELYSREC